jgi:hypothetical protein
MLLTPSYFEGDIAIGQVEQPDVAARVQLLINQHEPLYLQSLLGARLAGELEEAMGGEAPPQKWAALSEQLLRPCALWVYCYYNNQNATVATAAGEATPKVDNATRKSAVLKTVAAWNEMATLSLKALRWVEERSEEYGNPQPECMAYFRPINELGI